MDARLVWKPITRWPREQTRNRDYSPFRRTTMTSGYRRDEVGWTTTKPELLRELRLLGVGEAVIQLALTDRDIRIDGQVRANARFSHPGVIVTFTAPGKGVLTFACDKWDSWQANIRGITKGLEALRLLDRYGITTTGEQYTGWKELPSGVPLAERPEAEPMTLQEAARCVVGWISGPHDLEQNARTAIEDADFRRYAFRQAVRHVHPDAGGDDSDGFIRLQAAMKILDENDA